MTVKIKFKDPKVVCKNKINHLREQFGRGDATIRYMGDSVVLKKKNVFDIMSSYTTNEIEFKRCVQDIAPGTKVYVIPTIEDENKIENDNIGLLFTVTNIKG